MSWRAWPSWPATKTFNWTIISPGMNQNYLEFEQSIADLEAKIEALRFASRDSDVNIS